MAEGSRFAKSLRSPVKWIVVGLMGLFLVSATFAIRQASLIAMQGVECQRAHTIYVLLFQYSIDHNNRFPNGKSSTEVFQKLIDEKYATDPTIFYFPMPGKTASTSNILKPENVCWDVTACNVEMPEETPLLFETGYKISYVPGGSAVPISGISHADTIGFVVVYNNGGTHFSRGVGEKSAENDTSLISSTFNPSGKKFQQLTPDGPLP